MKTLPLPHEGSSRRLIFTALLSVGFIASFAPIARGEDVPKPADGGLTLFVGTDFAVKQDDKYYHVIGATADTLQIERDHGLKETRNIRGSEIQIRRGVKLSSLSADISNVHTESVDREASRAQFAAMQASMLLDDTAVDAQDRLAGNVVFANSVGVNPNAAVGAAITAAEIAANQKATSDAYATGAPVLATTATSESLRFSERLETSSSPEVEMSFDVSSAVPLENAFVVVVANYASASGDKIAHAVAAQQLDQVGSQPRTVRVTHAASVAGLEFKKFDIGLFANGQEVATNLSGHRMALTPETAYEYCFLNYLVANKGKTLPPATLLMASRMQVRREISQAPTGQVVYATVDKKGSLVSLTNDEAGHDQVPTEVAVALHNVRFIPALDNGSPVDGRLKLNLATLAD